MKYSAVVFFLCNCKKMEYIKSFTLKELLDNRDGDFIHHDEYTDELSFNNIKLHHAFANTLVFKVKSANYKTNHKVYTVAVLFEDFYCIANDKDISFEDAVDYAVNFGDVHIACDCPAFLYWGYRYIATELSYLYGIPREKRFPKVRNPQVRGTTCKHSDKVIRWCLQNKKKIAKMFLDYYSKLRDTDDIIVVNELGDEIKVGNNLAGEIDFDEDVNEMIDIVEEVDDDIEL